MADTTTTEPVVTNEDGKKTESETSATTTTPPTTTAPDATAPADDANNKGTKREREEDGTNSDSKRLATGPTIVAAEELTEYVEVPDQHVGRVIGKAGASIRVMQNLSGAHIDVPQVCEPNTKFRKVKIVGKKSQLDYCRSLILQKCDPEDAEGPIVLPSDGSAITKDVMIPDDMVGKIIGKGGATIRQLQDLSGAHVDVAKAPDAGQDTRRVTLTGNESQVGKCKELIEMKLAGQPLPSSNSGVSGVAHMSEQEMKVLVPNDMVGKIIGKGGETIRHIQGSSGAHMDIAKECAPGSQQREVTIKGTTTQMAYCNLLLQEKLSNNDVNAPGYIQAYTHYVRVYQATQGRTAAYGQEAYGSYGAQQSSYGQTDPYSSYYQAHNYGGQGYNQVQSQQYGNYHHHGANNKPHIVMSVPNEHVGRIIGKGGVTIKEIMQASGAHIDIPPDVGASTRELKLIGDEKQTYHCQTLIQQKLAVDGSGRLNTITH